MPGQVPTYLLVGGPCDGKIGQISPQISTARQLICQNHVYKEGDPPVLQGGHVLFKDAGKVPKPNDNVPSPRAHRGWHSLSRTLNKRWHPTITQVQRDTRAALHAMGRGRKVKR